jgi:pantetheine-phosphate adenylyltransferase
MAGSSKHRIAVFPGQFDPITNGPIDVVRRGIVLFDELIVAVGKNPDKRELFPLDDRVAMIADVLREIPGARVAKFEGLTVDFVRGIGATAILRGIRDASDLHYEFQLAQANRAVGGVETVFIMTGDPYALTSSSLIRQIVMLGADLDKLQSLVPATVLERLRSMKRRGTILRPSAPDTPVS